MRYNLMYNLISLCGVYALAIDNVCVCVCVLTFELVFLEGSALVNMEQTETTNRAILKATL